MKNIKVNFKIAISAILPILLLITISCSKIKSTKYFEDGKRLLKEKKYEEAIKSFETCYKLDNKNHQALEAIAIAYGSMEQYDTARTYFEKAVELKPRNKLYLMNLAITYVKLKEYSKAKDIYYRVLALDKNNKSAKQALMNIEELGY